jgi:VCBS repeat-containing protein
VGAAVVAAGIAAGLAVGPLSSHARLSGSSSRLATGSAAPSQAGVGQPDPRPDAPPARPGPGRRTPGARTTTSPAAGGADAVASGKQPGLHGGTRAGGQSGSSTHRTVTVDLVPSTPAGQPGPAPKTQATARLTVSPASLVLGQGSSGTFTLTASGGSVPWSASASGSVAVSPASGQLGNGDSAAVSVTVQRAGNSGGSATVSINGAQVAVSWSATPAASAPYGASGSTGASGASGAGSAGSSPPPARRHHRPSAGGSPAPAGP